MGKKVILFVAIVFLCAWTALPAQRAQAEGTRAGWETPTKDRAKGSGLLPMEVDDGGALGPFSLDDGTAEIFAGAESTGLVIANRFVPGRSVVLSGVSFFTSGAAAGDPAEIVIYEDPTGTAPRTG